MKKTVKEPEILVDEPDESDKVEIWRKKQLVLPEEVVEQLALWHGGQNTATYRLMSTGMRNLVSPAMIYDAELELESIKARGQEKKDLEELLGELEGIRRFWQEHTGQSAGMDLMDEDIEHDDANYDFDDEEAEELLS